MSTVYGEKDFYFSDPGDDEIEMGVWMSWNHFMTRDQARAVGEKLIALAGATPTPETGEKDE